MSNLKLFIVLFIGIIEFINVQAELDYVFFDVDVDYNSDFYSDVETYINDGNRGVFCNFTLKKSYPEDTKITFNVIGASMGNYVINTGLHSESLFCDMFDPEYDFLNKQVEKFGFKRNECPPSPNVYGTENYEPELSALPDDFVPNDYLVIVKIFTPKIFISDFKLYVRIL